MRTFAPAVATCVLLALGTVLAQASDPVAVTLETFLVVADGQTIPVSTPAPGDTLEYRLTARNVGDAALPAGRVVLTLPVPEGGSYQHGSATRGPTIDKVYADAGGTYNFAFTPTTERIRWTYLAALAPGASFQVSARFRLSAGAPDPRDGGAPATAPFRRDIEAFVEAMFAHLGIVRYPCAPRSDRTIACGEVDLEERIFTRSWDLYATSAADLPVAPPVAHGPWQRGDDAYSRSYSFGAVPLYVSFGDGFVYLAW